jgi:hypothetical protein
MWGFISVNLAMKIPTTPVVGIFILVKAEGFEPIQMQYAGGVLLAG